MSLNNKKFAFTLAEITIVFMAIAIICVLTIPALQKYLADAKYRTSYRKVYNEVNSIVNALYSTGQIPQKPSIQTNELLFETMLDNFTIKGFAPNSESDLDSGEIYSMQNFSAGLEYTSSTNFITTIGEGDLLSFSFGSISSPSPWIITEDNVAYSVFGSGTDSCYFKENINSSDNLSSESIIEKACAVIIVDLNGLSKGPNKIEEQVLEGVDGSMAMDRLKGDRYYIYLAKNGIASGSKATSVSGRILADLK